MKVFKLAASQICSDEFLHRIVSIIGSSSAAAQAMAERDRRNATGEKTFIFWNRNMSVFIVGPLSGFAGGEKGHE